MFRGRNQALCGAIAGIALIIGAGRALAMEPGNSGQTTAGMTIGEAVAAPLPAGVYIISNSYIAPGNIGAGHPAPAGGFATGQNFGTTITAFRYEPGIYWSTGFNFLGANWSMSVVQPFSFQAAYPTNGATLGGNGIGPPFGNTVWFEDVGNTKITPILGQWTLGGGWFGALGLTLIAPDGSRYNGTLNPDYFTAEPRAAIAYISPDWHVTANLKYDINGASTGHTGTYQIAANLPFPLGFGGTPLAPVIAGIGNGYRSGQELFLDVAATHLFGNFEIGPVASFKWQTTADRPGGGFTCPQLQAALPPTLSCGRAQTASVGALAGYNFGPADLQVWATDTVSSRDDFRGWGVFSRLSFALWTPNAAVPALLHK